MNRALTLPLLAIVLSLTALGFGSCGKSEFSLEILHVNDLHSNLDHGSEPSLGGYAAVKAMLDKLKREARAAGRETLVLNGGDSFEGNPYFFGGNGSSALKALAAMGFDATVIGNHDWLMGATEFNRLVGEMPGGFTFLGANFSYDKAKYPALARKLKPYVELDRGGLKIEVIGVATNSVFYRWASDDVKITNPLIETQKVVAKLRLRNNIIVVLSHLGTADDAKLVERTIGIDLVVGAHDHSALPQPLFKKNPIGRMIPILQARAFGEAIGQLRVTARRDGTYKIHGYQLIPVPATGPRDAAIDRLALQAREALEARFAAQFGSAWLDETVATAAVPLENAEHEESLFGRLSAQALREAADADIGMDFGVFHGMTQAAGPVTRRTLMRLYPRMFELDRKQGWTVWRLMLPGALLEKSFEMARKAGFRFDVSWPDAEAGHAIDRLRLYSVAVPEGIARGLIEVPKLYDHIAWDVVGETATDVDNAVLAFVARELSAFTESIHDTGVPVWTALERKFRAMGEIR